MMKLRQAKETGAMALPTTRKALRRYSFALIVRAVVSVVALVMVDTTLFRIDPPEAVATVLALIIIALALVMLGAVMSYFRLVLMRWVLRRNDWQVVSGCSRAVFLGPLPLAQVAIVDWGGDVKQSVDYVGPLTFSRRLPGELLPANMLATRWAGFRVYSSLDGANPSFAVKVRPGLLRKIFMRVVPHV